MLNYLGDLMAQLTFLNFELGLVKYLMAPLSDNMTIGCLGTKWMSPLTLV